MLLADFLAHLGLAFILVSSGEELGWYPHSTFDKMLQACVAVYIMVVLCKAGIKPDNGTSSAISPLKWLASGGSAAARIDAEMQDLRIQLLAKDATIMYLKQFRK